MPPPITKCFVVTECPWCCFITNICQTSVANLLLPLPIHPSVLIRDEELFCFCFSLTCHREHIWLCEEEFGNKLKSESKLTHIPVPNEQPPGVERCFCSFHLGECQRCEEVFWCRVISCFTVRHLSSSLLSSPLLSSPLLSSSLGAPPNPFVFSSVPTRSLRFPQHQGSLCLFSPFTKQSAVPWLQQHCDRGLINMERERERGREEEREREKHTASSKSGAPDTRTRERERVYRFRT